MKRIGSIVAVALCILAGPAWVGAQTTRDVLRAIPDDALGFAVLNRINETHKKMEGLAQRIAPGKGAAALEPFVEKLKDLKGLNVMGSRAAVLMPAAEKGSRPAAVFYIPVRDYQEFIGQFGVKEDAGGITEFTPKGGEASVAAHHGKFALVAEKRDRAALKRALDAKKSVADSVKPLAKWIGDNDIAGVLTSAGVKWMGKEMRSALHKAQKSLPEAPQLRPFGRMFEGLDRFVKSFEHDVTLLGLAGKIESGNVHVDARALFASDSGFAQRASKLKPLEGGPLAGLPAGPFVLAMGGVLPEDALQAMSRFGMTMMTVAMPDLTPEKLQKLEGLSAAAVKGMRGMGMVLRAGKSGDPLLKHLVMVEHVDDARGYLANYEKYTKQASDLLGDLFPRPEFHTHKIDGVPVLEGAFETPKIAVSEEQRRVVEQIYAKIFGGQKIRVSLAAVDDKTILAQYAPAAEMKHLLSQAKKHPQGLAKDPEIAKTAALLPQGAQWALYISPRGVTEMVNQAMNAFASPRQPFPTFPKTAPIGVAARLSADGLQIHAVIPADVLDGLGKFIPEVEKLKQAP